MRFGHNTSLRCCHLRPHSITEPIVQKYPVEVRPAPFPARLTPKSSRRRLGYLLESRKTGIPAGFQPTFIALDGPLLPRGADKLIRRPCESVFIHAPFHSRCKPGLSHWGCGLELRRASAEACAQFSRVLGSFASDGEEVPVSRSGPIVEQTEEDRIHSVLPGFSPVFSRAAS